VPKEMGIYTLIDSPNKLDTRDIIDRIVDNRTNYTTKYLRTSKKEDNYYSNDKEYVPEV
jgi:hypothetical protein